jgi:DNA-binding response OmpR family regulator
MRLLIIEDDKNLIRLLKTALKPLGYAVDAAENGEKGLNLALINNYDLIITDYNLPRLSGREIIEKIRSEKQDTPIIVLSVRSEINDRVELLNLGADDYLAKPFTLAELLARVKALLRRPQNLKNKVLKIGDIEMQPERFLVTKNGKKLLLSSKEFSLLQYLVENKGEILSRQKIMEHVWDENADPFSNTIEVHIMNLRKKIRTRRTMIFTYSNRGYKIDTER